MKIPEVESILELNELMDTFDLIKPVYYKDDRIMLLDQRQLPFKEEYLMIESPEEVATAISSMQIRGGGAIPIAAAYAFLLAKRQGLSSEKMEDLGNLLIGTRPTASSLRRIVDSLQPLANDGVESMEKAVVQFISGKLQNEIDIAEVGAKLVNDGDSILTHCHAGALAGCGYGNKTLGIFKLAQKQGKKIHVYSTETRPYMQGARITTWELMKFDIPTTLITDSMAGYFLSQGEIQFTLVGADRIAGNGDVVNKIGTYPIALACKDNNVPFYVGAFREGVDLNVTGGEEIPIEMRDPSDITNFGYLRLATPDVDALYPTFDITPNRLVSGFITPWGVISFPFESNLLEVFDE